MSVDLDDEAAIRRLRDEFRGVSFGRTIGGLRPPRPNPYAVSGILLLSTATVTVALSLGSTPKSLSAWSPTLRPVSAGDETRARQACAAGLGATPVGSHGSFWSLALTTRRASKPTGSRRLRHLQRRSP